MNIHDHSDRRVRSLEEPSAVGHPRPLLRRDTWWTLDGDWDFSIDESGAWSHPDEVKWTSVIHVPFAPETPASGICHRDYIRQCWYRRTLAAPPANRRGERILLHFGAVDHQATVWLDGHLVGRHEGGYSPFWFDVTRLLRGHEEHELVVLAEDDPLDLAKPRGKQDWEEQPHSIWYHRTTGIWQCVWLERLPGSAIDDIEWSSDLDRLEVTMDVRLTAPLVDGLALHVALRAGERVIVDDVIAATACRVVRGFRLDASGLDHLRESLFWSPDHPNLIDGVLELRDSHGAVIDRVHTYTAIRQVELRAGRFVINGRPQQLRLVLDQGYWEDSGLTPPSDEAIRRDIELVKAMGFNGIRKHQKIEDPRSLYWADRLGLFVWVEMPPAYQFDAVAVRRMTDEWVRVVQRDRSHPCIVAWVPFNESTGVLRLPNRADQRHWVRALTELTRAVDPTRPVVSNDGWETVDGDIIAVHDYDQDPEALVARWGGDLREPITGYAAHGRLQTLDEDADRWSGGRPDRPIMLTEFGGIGWGGSQHVDADALPEPDSPTDRMAQPAAWGYSSVSSGEELAARYEALLEALHRCDRIAGFCYTQLADTYQEVNGLLRADRTPKVPLEVIARATRGPGHTFFDPLHESG